MPRSRCPDAELLALHARLVAGDPTASSELAEAVFDELVGRLVRFSRTTPEEAVDAVSLALMNYIKKPSGYDQTKCKLRTYLHIAARRDFLNEREKARRVADHEKQVARIEDLADNRNKLVEVGGDHDSERPDRRLEIKEAQQLVKREFPSSRDREIIQLMLDGVRDCESYARVLGLAAIPIERQRKIVKQHKDRIQKRLQRLREQHYHES